MKVQSPLLCAEQCSALHVEGDASKVSAVDSHAQAQGLRLQDLYHTCVTHVQQLGVNTATSTDFYNSLTTTSLVVSRL
jgi:hypothetical protein